MANNYPLVANSSSLTIEQLPVGDTLVVDNLIVSGDTETGNIMVSNAVPAAGVFTDNLYYSNGATWDLQEPQGSTGYVQYNDGSNNFGASANLVFDESNNVFLLNATANVNDLNASGEMSVSGNATIGGNLAVNGNLTYVNVETITVEDPIIDLGGGSNGAPPVANDGKDRGTQLQYFDGVAKNAFMGFINANGQFIMASNATITNDVLSAVTLGDLAINNLTTANISAGNVDGGNIVMASYLEGELTGFASSQPNITSVGTLTSLVVSGNGTFANVYANSGIIGAQNLKGEGGNLSNIQGANVSGTVSSATTAGTVTSSAQANITSVGTLTSLSVSGPFQLATYASNAARDSAILTPAEGMMVYVTGDGMQVYGATQWNTIAGSGT